MNNETAFVIVALLNSMILTYSMTGLSVYPPGKLCRILMFSCFFLCQICFAPSLGQGITFFTIGGALLLLLLLEKHRISNLIFSCLGYLINIAINYALTVPMNLAGYTLSYMASSFPFMIIFMAVYGTLTVLAVFFLGKIIRKSFVNRVFAFPVRLQALFLLELLLCVCVCIFNIMQGGTSWFPSKIIYYNAAIFITFFVITFIIFFFSLKILQKNNELLRAEQNQQALKEYTQKLEDLYQDLRIFRHDYINILSTMQGYIDNNDTEQLKEYFTDKILPESRNLTGKEDVIGRLSRIKVLELKGILYSKLIAAMNLGLDVTLEIQKEITSVAMERLDLSVLIGIFMNNALEAAAQSPERRLVVAVITGPEAETILISNSCVEDTLPLERIYEKEYTSRPGHSGLGLYSARKILGKYPNVIHSTACSDHRFVQTLEIGHTEKVLNERGAVS